MTYLTYFKELNLALKVNEIFYSIQGESSFAGLPCVFVRLSGCNLRCSYCDTTYAYDEGAEMELEEVLEKIEHYNCRLVELTGGEPLLQKETPELIRRLLDRGCRVLMETNGSLDISTVDERCIRIMDVKCPSSGMHEKNDLENLKRLRDKDELKFVIGDRADYEYARNVLELAGQSSSSSPTVHFSPSFGRIILKDLASWILEDALNVRLHVQLHKFIWGPSDRGV
jgi:7-carboxy-7-deazaguanine synthase